MSMNVHIAKLNTSRTIRGSGLNATNNVDSNAAIGGNSGYDRLFNLAMTKYEQAIRSTPDNSNMLTHYAGVLIKVALLKTQMVEPSAIYFEKALGKLVIAGNSTALLQLGELLQFLKPFWNETYIIYILASRCFEAVVAMDPTNTLAFSGWADTLILHARAIKSPALFALAGSKYRESIRIKPLSGYEWLSSCYMKLTNEELATALELVGRPRLRRCDSSSPILESTPTGDPISPNPKELHEYERLVRAVSYPLVHDGNVGSQFKIDFETPTANSSSAPTTNVTTITAPLSPSTGFEQRNTLHHLDSQESLGTSTPTHPVLKWSDPTPTGSLLDASLVFNKSFLSSTLLDNILAHNTGMTVVRLEYCPITSPALDSYCNRLVELNVSGCGEINDNWIGRVVNIPTLSKIDISHCKKLTYTSFRDILTKCCNLTHFYANNFGGATDSKLDPQLGFASSVLQVLHLSGFRTSAESWCRLIASSNLSSLRKINLTECLDINDAVLTALGQNCPITHISIRGCIHVTDTGIESLVKPYSKHKLNTSHNNASIHNSSGHIRSSSNRDLKQSSPPSRRLTVDTLGSGVHHHTKSIQYLDLSECKDITTRCLNALATHLTALEVLLLNNAGKIDFFGNPSGRRTVTSTNLKTSRKISSQNLRASSTRDHMEISPLTRVLETNPNLARLELNHTSAGDLELSATAAHCSRLTQLKMVSGTVTSEGLHYLAKSELQLELLDIERANLNDTGLKDFAKSCGKNLEALSLSGCSSLDLGEDALITIALNCRSLTLLDLSHSSVATDLSVSMIADFCPNLKRLSLVECKMITDRSLESLAKHSHKLQYLNLTRCSLLVSLGPLGEGCPELRELHARGCEYLSDDTAGYDRLANLRNLRFLDIYGCRHITDNTLALLETNACPDLQTLALGRNKIRDISLKSLQESRPNLMIIHSSEKGSLASALNPTRTSTGLNKSGTVLSSSSTEITSVSSPTVGTHAAHMRKSLGLAGNSTKVALRALMYDLKMIEEHPISHVSAHPVDLSEMFVWHCNLMGPEGTHYAGVVFHIELVFPTDYPTNPPSATLFTPLAHPHVHKDRICLDILSDYQGYFSAVDELEGNQARFSGDWNSKYTVQSILLQMQSFLMDLNENAHETALSALMLKIPESIRLAKSFCCPKCSHKPGNPWPPLKDSPTLTLAKTEREIVAEELRCVHTRVPFTEDVLGICVHVVERKANGSITRIRCFLELLSNSAFIAGVRTGPKAAKHLVLLPLWIDNSHGFRAMSLMEQAIAQIYSGKPTPANFEPEMALEVLTQMMKSMALDLMDNKMPSIHALQYYFACHRLLIAFIKKYPILLTKANEVVSKFADSNEYRSKKYCPDLGTFLALLSIADIPWREVAWAYMQESFIRHVYWAIEKHPELAKDVPDPVIDRHRSDKMLLLTKLSMSVCMLQVYFLEHVGRPKDTTLDEVASRYDSLYGRLSVKVREEFLDAVKRIQRIQTWDETFAFIGLPPMASEELTAWHLECVILSLKAGYHRSSSSSQMRSSGTGRICNFWVKHGKCNKSDCKFLHTQDLAKYVSSSGGSPRVSRNMNGQMKRREYDPLRDSGTSFNSSHPATPRRGHSRNGSHGSSSASSSSGILSPTVFDPDYGEYEDLHVNEHDFDTKVCTPGKTPTGVRTGSPHIINEFSSPITFSGRGTAWTGSNAFIDRARRDNPKKPEHFVELRPAPQLVTPLEPTLHSATQSHPVISVLPPDDDEEGWQQVGPRRQRNKSAASHQPPHSPQFHHHPTSGTPTAAAKQAPYSPVRGWGRGQPSRDREPNRHR